MHQIQLLAVSTMLKAGEEDEYSQGVVLVDQARL